MQNNFSTPAFVDEIKKKKRGQKTGTSPATGPTTVANVPSPGPRPRPQTDPATQQPTLSNQGQPAGPQILQPGTPIVNKHGKTLRFGNMNPIGPGGPTRFVSGFNPGGGGNSFNPAPAPYMPSGRDTYSSVTDGAPAYGGNPNYQPGSQARSGIFDRYNAPGGRGYGVPNPANSRPDQSRYYNPNYRADPTYAAPQTDGAPPGYYIGPDGYPRPIPQFVPSNWRP